MEKYLTRLFGEGYLRNENIQKFLKNLQPKNTPEDAKINERQEFYEEILKTDQMTDEERQNDFKNNDNEDEKIYVHGRTEKEESASMFFKFFGKEIFYSQDIMKENPFELLNIMRNQFNSPRSMQVNCNYNIYYY